MGGGIGAVNDLFSLAQGEAEKEIGMLTAAERRKIALDAARRIAIMVALRSPERCVTADSVHREMLRQDMDTDLGNAWGSLFRGKQWEFTGEWRKSPRITNHARMNRVWRLK